MKNTIRHLLTALTICSACVAAAQDTNGELGPMPPVSDPTQYRLDTEAARRIADAGSGSRYCTADGTGGMRFYMDIKTRITYLYPSANGNESPLPERGLTYTLKKLKVTNEMVQGLRRYGMSGTFSDEGRIIDFKSQNESGQILTTAIFMLFKADGSDTVLVMSDAVNGTFFAGSLKSCH